MFLKNAEKQCERTKPKFFENDMKTIYKNERCKHIKTNIFLDAFYADVNR